MDQQHDTNDNPWTILQRLCGYIKQGQERMPLEGYQSTIRTYRNALVRSVCNNGIGNITIFIGFLSGICELAAVFAIQLAPKFFSGLADNPGWNAYTEISPITTVAFGLAVLAIGKIFSYVSSEKYKARRGLPSVYPPYRCSWANICCTLLFSLILFYACLYFLSTSFWPICLLSATISVFRLSWLLPSSVQIPTIKGHKEKTIRLNPALRLSIALFAPLSVGLAIFKLNPWPALPPSQLLAMTLAVQLLLLMLWIAASGSQVVPIWHQEHRKNRTRNKATEPREEDVRTPEGWFIRNLPYNVFELICLFTLLVIAPIIPAPIFISLDLIPVFAP